MQIAFGVVLMLFGLHWGYSYARVSEIYHSIRFLLLAISLIGMIYGLIVFRQKMPLVLFSIAAVLFGLTVGIGAILWSHKLSIGLIFAGTYYIPFLIVLGIRWKRGTLHWK